MRLRTCRTRILCFGFEESQQAFVCKQHANGLASHTLPLPPWLTALLGPLCRITHAVDEEEDEEAFERKQQAKDQASHPAPPPWLTDFHGPF